MAAPTTPAVFNIRLRLTDRLKRSLQQEQCESPHIPICCIEISQLRSDDRTEGAEGALQCLRRHPILVGLSLSTNLILIVV